MSSDRCFPRIQAEEVCSPLRHARRQHGAVHRGAHRQRPALSRLRHPRPGRALRVRRSGLPADPRQAAQHRGTDRVQGTAGASAQYSRGGEAGAGAAAAFHAPHGCAAYGRVGAGLHLSRGRRPQRGSRAPDRRFAAGVSRLHAALLAPFCAQRPAHRSGGRRRLDCRAFAVPAARARTLTGVGCRDAGFADPLRRA